MANRRTSRSLTFDADTFKEIEDCMKGLGFDPNGWGEESRYVEDAVKLKNALVKAGKWVPFEEVDIEHTVIKSKRVPRGVK